MSGKKDVPGQSKDRLREDRSATGRSGDRDRNKARRSPSWSQETAPPATSSRKAGAPRTPRGEGAHPAKGKRFQESGAYSKDKSDIAQTEKSGQSAHPAQSPQSSQSTVMPDEPVRVNKALAAAGICSRRAADDLIAQGAVSINGQVVTTPGVKVMPGKDVLAVNGVAVNLLGQTRSFAYIIMNKPARVVTTVKDPQGRTTVLDLLPAELKNGRLYPVGRLDFFSEGLLLLTDDGEMTYRLTHPKWHLTKVYRVRVRGSVPDSALKIMRSGMTLAEGEKLAPVKVNVLREENDITTLEMHLMQGVNRQIRRMCRDLGLTILSLKRFRQGPLDLGNLERGKFRMLDEAEVSLLRRSAGLE
ncbi:pseudouridine synthase [Desulfovibrio psychrotolerans]|uniref:Pseudouridine synthase n=1 Tax=Desulfovibrio psychrotolerans TaxID=415242 RepID=A0A7J0BP51_9BACT|nr:pseudouridine synthase [Desulfovibrio psychrotolerans]GFM35477.1 hypothetical protein DSM19430T_01610 [Desulfovibrio psychrotolerans]